MKKKIITDPRGQWAHPGKPTRIPSNEITMQGVPYPVMAYPDFGKPVLMQPGQNYNFPEATYVDEYPIVKKGGSIKRYPSLPNKKDTKRFSKSLMATNKLFTQHPLLAKPRKNKIYDPKSKYFQDGGNNTSSLVPKNYQDSLTNFVYPQIIDLPEETENERWGYDAAMGVIRQNPNDPIINMNNPWWGEHELFHHLQNQAGALSTYGLVGQRPNPFVASNESIGSYYDRRGLEFKNELNKILQNNPDLSEEEAYDLAEENLYKNPTSVEGEARNYEGYIDAGNPSIFNKQQGGYIELELDDNEIDEYKKGGYIVEDISVTPLNKFVYQDGGELYTVPGSKSVYRKVKGKWEVDTNRSGNFQPLTKGDVKQRTAILNKQAKPYYDRDYSDMLNTKSSTYSNTKTKTQPAKTSSKETTKAQQNFDKNFAVTKDDRYTEIKNQIEKDKEKYIQIGKEKGFEVTQQDLDDIENRGWNTLGNVGVNYTPTTIGKNTSGNISTAFPNNPTFGDYAQRGWEYLTNPFTAFEYAVSGGGAENMPYNINQLRVAGVDPGVVEGRNLVGNTLNATTNLFDAGDKVIRNVGEGNYGTAALEAMRFLPGARVSTGLGSKAGEYLITKIPTLKRYIPTGIPNNVNIDFNRYLTQEEAVAARAERMLQQEGKWVGQNNSELKKQFEKARSNHNSELTTTDWNLKHGEVKSPESLGVNKFNETIVYKDAPLSESNKARVAAHETGHYYKNTFDEGEDWNSFFDFSNLKQKTRDYLAGKGMRGRGSIMGDEIRERAAQLKDYIAQKNNIPLNKNFTITKTQLDDAIANYVKDTGLNNNMTQMLSSLKDKKGFLKAMNKYALGLTPTLILTDIMTKEKE